VILPKRNLKDLVDIPRKARSELKIVPVEHMDRVLEVALSPEPALDLTEKPKKEQGKHKKSKETLPAPSIEVPDNQVQQQPLI